MITIFSVGLALSFNLAVGCGSRTGLLDEAQSVGPDANLPTGRCARTRVPDFNGDGFDDVAVVSRSGVLVYYGARGRLPTTPSATIPLPAPLAAESTTPTCIGDLDGDGTSELALYRRSAQSTPGLPGSPYRAGELFIVSGSRAGLVASSVRRVASPPGVESNFPYAVRHAGRFVSGSRGAFVATLTEGRGAFVFQRVSDGLYEAQSAQPIEGGPGGAYAGIFARGAGDVDGDGLDDLAVATDAAAIFYAGSARGPMGLRRRMLYTDVDNRVGPYLDGVGDVTRDGCNDLLLLSFAEPAALSVFVGGPDFGSPTPWAPRAPNGRPVAINGSTDFLPVGDVDGDGAADLLLYGTCLSGPPCASGAYERYLYRGSAAGLTAAPIPMPSMTTRSFTQHPLGDLDGDGRAEMGESTTGSDRLTVWRGTPSGYVVGAREALTSPGLVGTSFTGSVP